MIIIYTTCPSKKEAEKISMQLLKKRLAGCCNIFPIRSSYLWKGRIEHAVEYAMIIKSSKKHFPAVKRLIKKLHSYEVPCIEGWNVDFADKPYSKWFDLEMGR